MENLFNMEMTPADVNAVTNLGLAHIGDGVYELLCRSYLINQGGKTVLKLHNATVELVKAPTQAKFADKLKPYLTEDRWQDILSVTPPIYNPHLPFFSWQVTVERADESELYWRTDWFPIGTTRTGVTPDGYDPVHGLSG